MKLVADSGELDMLWMLDPEAPKETVCRRTVVVILRVVHPARLTRRALFWPLFWLQEASGVRAEVAELTSQNQALNKTFMALAGW